MDGHGQAGAFNLNQEQLQHLLKNISSDEKAELEAIVKKCSGEILTTRALPFTAVVLGSLAFARSRLPPQYHFGPKGWPFYVVMGIASFTGATVLSAGKCQEQTRPKVEELWRKYQDRTHAKTSYDELRQQNRRGIDYGHQAEQHAPQMRHGEGVQRPISPSQPQAARPIPGYGSQPYGYGDASAGAYMSGTPSGDSLGAGSATYPSAMAARLAKETNKTNQYGDEGFS
ncbi:unnamed protein product, partial [Mesorhabditis spiculigera]